MATMWIRGDEKAAYRLGGDEFDVAMGCLMLGGMCVWYVRNCKT